MAIVTAHTAAKHAERLLDIFREIGVEPIASGGIERGVLSLWEVLEELANPGDPEDEQVTARYVAGAGIHDLAAKIGAVWSNRDDACQVIEPHLRLLSQTYYIGQNTANPRWDRVDGVPREHGSADKVIEIYWACLCLLAGMTVEIDDPVKSSAGKNPDIIATAADGTKWAFAIKTLAQVSRAENIAKNLAANIDKAISQILNADCDKGIIVVNLKNIIPHNDIRTIGPFAMWEDGADFILNELSEKLNTFYQEESQSLAPRFKEKSRVAPIVILVAHATALTYPPGSHKTTFTELKATVAAPLPVPNPPGIGTLGAEAVGVALAFNHLIQVVV